MDSHPLHRALRAFGPATLLLALALLMAGCPSGSDDGKGTGAGGSADSSRLDPVVQAALVRNARLSGNRVIVLGLDGADPDLVKELVAAGRLPHFRRLMEEGAFGPLYSQLPMLSPLLWTTIATGKWPTEHGVLDFLVRDESDPKKRTTVQSRNRQVEALWDIAGRYGRKVALVGWLASHPAERVNGWAVSERTELLAYLFGEKALASDEGKTWPPELIDELRPLRRSPSEVAREELLPFVDVTEEQYRAATATEEFSDDRRVNNLRLIHCAADNFLRMGMHLWRSRAPDLLCIYFEDLDAVSHNFMAYREPVTWKPRDADEILKFFKGDPPPGAPPVDRAMVEALVRKIRGEMPEEEKVQVPEGQVRYLGQIRELATGADPERVKRWGRAVDAAYVEADRILGEVMDAMDDRTTLLVVSDHGFESGPAKPPFDSSFRSTSGGAQYHRVEGLLAAFGRGVRKGFAVPAFAPVKPPVHARLLDIAPTALALMGFPKAKDMPGRVLGEIFDLDLATGEVDTYETGRSTRLAKERMQREERRRLDAGGNDPTEDAALEDAMSHLLAVGYVGTEEEGPVRALMHMAVSFLQQDRLEEAEEAFGEVLRTATGPQKLQALYQLGVIRRRSGDPAGAEKRFREALAAHPDFIPAMAGIAGLLEERGDREGTLAQWEGICALDRNPLFRLRLADSLRQASARSDPGERVKKLTRALEILEGLRAADGGGAAAGEGAFEAIRRNYMGMVLVDGGRLESAAEAFRQSAEADGKYLRPRNNMAVVCMRQAAYDVARAAELADPAAREPHLRNAAAQREAALAWADGVLAIDPANPKARYNRAEVFAKIPPTDLPAAEKELLLALESARDYRRAKQLLEEVRSARRKMTPPR